MNLELLETFHQNYPEAADGFLERIKKDENNKDISCATYAITLQFNRPGSLLAIGCNDGRIEIWDFITRRIAKILVAHVHPVCSVSWSRDSRKLLTASTDNNVAVWDALSGDCERSFRLPCPVLKVQFHPRKSGLMLICPLRHPPILLDMEGRVRIIPPEDETDFNIVASFDRRGDYVYTGNSRGKVSIYNITTLELINSFRAATTAANVAIKSIDHSRRGDCFALNCADRVLRVFNCQDALKEKEPEPTQKLRDIVSGSHWRKVCFSGDGEYVCAGSMKQHSIYMWERHTGTLVKILNGQKGETLLDVVWHPLRPVVISLSNSYTKEQVSIWAQTQVQNWSAFAPDFKELDENVEYEERESEFDVDDDDKSHEEPKPKDEEDIEVDIETVEPVSVLLSSDEEEEQTDVMMFLPVTPEVDNPEEMVDDAQHGDAAANPQELTGGSRKRGADGESPTKAKKSRKPIDIDLPNAMTNEVHPLISNRRPAKSTVQAAAPSTSTTTAPNHRKTTGRSQRDRSKNRTK